MARYVVLSVIAVAVAGCLGAADGELQTREVDSWDYQWTFDEEEAIGYVFDLQTGEAKCRFLYEYRGSMTDPSRLGGFTMKFGETGSMFFHTGYENTIHVLDWNSASVTTPVWEEIATWEYAGSGSSDIPAESRFMALAVLMQPHLAATDVGFSCSGDDVHLRAYSLDGVGPLLSYTATGGAGASVPGPAGPLSLNIQDHVAIDTAGEFIFFWAFDALRQGDSFRESEVSITWPNGSQGYAWDSSVPVSSLLCQWVEPGDYKIELDRVAWNAHDFLGVLAGFALEDEVGAPRFEPAPAPYPFHEGLPGGCLMEAH